MAQNETPGVQVSLETMYKQQLATDSKVTKLETLITEYVAINKRLDSHADVQDQHAERIRKVEAQVAAQWVIVSIVVVVIGTALARAIITG